MLGTYRYINKMAQDLNNITLKITNHYENVKATLMQAVNAY